MPSRKIIEAPELRDAPRVFRDRADAGQRLAGLLEEYRGSHALVLGIPDGGVPVADAYERWTDVRENEGAAILERFSARSASASNSSAQ